MKQSITRIVLEKLLEAGELTLDIFFPPNYSYTRISRHLFGLDSYPAVSPPTLSAILSRLKRQGLVRGAGSRKKTKWSLTRRGKRFVQQTKGDIIEREIPPLDGICRLVIFDIPEKERKKRDLLRAELAGYNFQRLQRSVWMGFNSLPEDFVILLDTLHLKGKVHIFSVREKGTLEV